MAQGFDRRAWRRAGLGLAIVVAALSAFWLLLDDGQRGHMPGEDDKAASVGAVDHPPDLRGLAEPPDTASSSGAPEPSPDASELERELAALGALVSGAPEPATDASKPWRFAGASPDRDTGVLRLRVTDGAGHPRDGVHADLWVMPSGGRSVPVFDSDLGPSGEVEVPALRPGFYLGLLRLRSLQRSVRFGIAVGRVTEAEIPFPAGAVVEGTVRHLVKGPLAGVEVTLGGHRTFDARQPWTSDKIVSTTAEEGRYRLEDVPPGVWPVSLQGDAIGFSPRKRAEVIVTGTGTVTRDFLLGGVSFRGAVRSTNGTPLPGVLVKIQDPLYFDVTTDSKGVFEFRDLPDGDFSLYLSKDGYAFRSGRTGPVAAGGGRETDFVLEPAAALTLTLVDSEGGPVTGEFSLVILPAGGTGRTSLATDLRTDGQGRASYRQVLPGLYDVSASTDRHETTTVRVDVRLGENPVSLVLRGRPGYVDSSIRGRVLDGTNRRPLPGVDVRVANSNMRWATTDVNGAFGLPVPAGGVTLEVSLDGYGIRFVRDIQVRGGRTEDILLEPAATLRLRLLDAAGAPVGGRVTLGIKPLEGTEGTNVGTSVTADEAGQAVYRQVLPGRYTLRVVTEGAGSAKLETDVHPGENTLLVRLE